MPYNSNLAIRVETQELRVYEYLGVRLPGVLFGIAVNLVVWMALLGE